MIGDERIRTAVCSLGADLAYEYQSAAPWLWATPKQPSLASGLGERASGAFPSGNAGEQGAA